MHTQKQFIYTLMSLKSGLCREVIKGLRDGCWMFCVPGNCIGVSYAFLWYGSILLGFYFLYAPLLPLIFVNRKLFRRITDCLLSSWESFNTVNTSLLRIKVIWSSWFHIVSEFFKKWLKQFFNAKIFRNIQRVSFWLILSLTNVLGCLSINCFSDWWLSLRSTIYWLMLLVIKCSCRSQKCIPWSFSRAYSMCSESILFSPEILYWTGKIPWWYWTTRQGR